MRIDLHAKRQHPCFCQLNRKLRHVSFSLSRFPVITDGANDQESSPEDCRIFEKFLGKTDVQSLPEIHWNTAHGELRETRSQGHFDGDAHHDAEGNNARQDVSPSSFLQAVSKPEPKKPAKYAPE